MARLLFTRDFKVSQSEAICAAPIGLPRCIVGEMYGPNLWMAGEEAVPNFSNRTLWLNERGP